MILPEKRLHLSAGKNIANMPVNSAKLWLIIYILYGKKKTSFIIALYAAIFLPFSGNRNVTFSGQRLTVSEKFGTYNGLLILRFPLLFFRRVNNSRSVQARAYVFTDAAADT